MENIENEMSVKAKKNRKYLVSSRTNMSIFRSLEIVVHGSETQLQVGENLNYLILRFDG